MANKHLILAIFADEAAAADAADALKESGITSGDAMGILAVDSEGKLKVDKVGGRSWGAGALIGTGALLLGPGAVLAAPLVGGGMAIAGGTALGGLHHKSLGMSDEDKIRLSGELQGGKAAVGVMVRRRTPERVEAQLTDLGGVPESSRWPRRPSRPPTTRLLPPRLRGWIERRAAAACASDVGRRQPLLGLGASFGAGRSDVPLGLPRFPLLHVVIRLGLST